jgi:hypothetical protein
MTVPSTILMALVWIGHIGASHTTSRCLMLIRQNSYVIKDYGCTSMIDTSCMLSYRRPRGWSWLNSVHINLNSFTSASASGTGLCTVGQVNVLTVKSPNNLATPLKCHWPFMFILLIPFGDIMPHSMNQWSRRFGFVRWTPTYEKKIMMIPRIFKLSYHEGCPGLCRDNRVYRCPYRTQWCQCDWRSHTTNQFFILFYFILFFDIWCSGSPMSAVAQGAEWPNLKTRCGEYWMISGGYAGCPGWSPSAYTRLLRQREERLGTCYLVLITWIVAWLGRLWPQWTVFQFKQVYATAAVIIQVEIP